MEKPGRQHDYLRNCLWSSNGASPIGCICIDIKMHMFNSEETYSSEKQTIHLDVEKQICR